MVRVSREWMVEFEAPLKEAASLFKAAYEYLAKHPGSILQGISVDVDEFVPNPDSRTLTLYLKREE